MENMKTKYLCLSIDSNYNSDLYVDVVENVNDAVKTLLHREINEGDGLSVAISKDGCKTRITLSDGNIDDEYFVVAEMIPMPTNRYAVAWWHAYDGVGFDLKGSSDDIGEAAAALDFYVRNYIEDKYIPGDYEDGDTSITADLGHEWEMLQVIDLSKEVAL